MKQFTLFEKLLTPDKPLIPIKKQDLSPKIQYTQFELDVENQTIMVNIPVREGQNFQNDLIKINEPLTIDLLKPLLRKFRGTRS